MTQQIVLKRGSSFAADLSYTPVQGGPANLADITITSQVRTQTGAPVATLTVLKDADQLGFQVFAPNGTSEWPYGTLAWDLKFVQDGSVFYSETVLISIVREVTQ